VAGSPTGTNAFTREEPAWCRRYGRGIARNQDELVDLFVRVFLLRIDVASQEAQRVPRMTRSTRRAAAKRAGRRSGRVGSARGAAASGRRGALDGTAPTAVAADELVALASRRPALR
jgi:hypothetical protein